MPQAAANSINAQAAVHTRAALDIATKPRPFPIPVALHAFKRMLNGQRYSAKTVSDDRIPRIRLAAQ
jgi:hypothetical protein